MVGLGTQDDVRAAKAFVTKGKITFPMVWDESFESWRRLGIAGQPAAVLVSADGRELGRWLGRADAHQKDILKLVG